MTHVMARDATHGAPTFPPIINVVTLELLNTHFSQFCFSYLSLCKRMFISTHNIVNAFFMSMHAYTVSIDTTSVYNFNIKA
jgi:hypothetical protein